MPASTFHSCLIIPAFCSMAKSRSTVCWVTDKVSIICVRHVSAIYTGRVYGKFTRERLSVFYVLTSALQMYAFFDTFSPFSQTHDKCKLLFFAMKILNKLADVDVLACGCNLLKNRRLWHFVLNPVHANSHEKIGELAHCRCCNTLLTNHFRNIGPANLFKKWRCGYGGRIAQYMNV